MNTTMTHNSEPKMTSHSQQLKIPETENTSIMNDKMTHSDKSSDFKDKLKSPKTEIISDTKTMNSDNKCWTCGKEQNELHAEWRNALNANELTCDECHRNEYPEQYEEEELSKMKMMLVGEFKAAQLEIKTLTKELADSENELWAEQADLQEVKEELEEVAGQWDILTKERDDARVLVEAHKKDHELTKIALDITKDKLLVKDAQIIWWKKRFKNKNHKWDLLTDYLESTGMFSEFLEEVGEDNYTMFEEKEEDTDEEEEATSLMSATCL